MSQGEELVRHLPVPPKLGREIVLYPYQRIGMPFLALLPLLALLGLFGIEHERLDQQNGALGVTVEYGRLTRLGRDGYIGVELRNGSSEEMPSTVVSIARDYLEAFRDVSFGSAEVTVVEEAFEIELEPIPPGETRVVRVEMRPEKYWRRHGRLDVRGFGDEEFSFDLTTMVYP